MTYPAGNALLARRLAASACLLALTACCPHPRPESGFGLDHNGIESSEAFELHESGGHLVTCRSRHAPPPAERSPRYYPRPVTDLEVTCHLEDRSDGKASSRVVQFPLQLANRSGDTLIVRRVSAKFIPTNDCNRPRERFGTIFRSYAPNLVIGPNETTRLEVELRLPKADSLNWGEFTFIVEPLKPTPPKAAARRPG